MQTNVRLPLPVEETGLNASAIYTPDVRAKIATLLRDSFFEKYNTFPGAYFHGGALWTRISVQVWTEVRRFPDVCVCVCEADGAGRRYRTSSTPGRCSWSCARRSAGQSSVKSEEDYNRIELEQSVRCVDLPCTLYAPVQSCPFVRAPLSESCRSKQSRYRSTLQHNSSYGYATHLCIFSAL